MKDELANLKVDLKVVGYSGCLEMKTLAWKLSITYYFRPPYQAINMYL